MLLYIIALGVFLVCMLLYRLREQYLRDFSHRLPRYHEESPSFRQRPKLAPRLQEERVASMAKQETLYFDLESKPVPHQESEALRSKSWRRRTYGKSTSGSSLHLGDKDDAGQFSMDHVPMSFRDFVWTTLFVLPGVYVQAVWGLVRVWLKRAFLPLLSPPDYEELTGSVLLETMAVTSFSLLRCVSGEHVATFTWTKVPVINGDNVTWIELLSADVSVFTKRLVRCKADGELLSPSDAFLIISFHLVYVLHPKEHALANWGINTDTRSPFVKTMSTVTAMYNYLGRNRYLNLSQKFYQYGLVRASPRAIDEVFTFAERTGFHPHGELYWLDSHSTLVHFVLRTRRYFMDQFAQYRASFMGIDGEALFVGTVLHSLDHAMFTHIVYDERLFNQSSARFGPLADLLVYVRACFTSDIPLVYFPRRMRDAPDEFFASVYAHARKIDPFLAEQMDCCIIK